MLEHTPVSLKNGIGLAKAAAFALAVAVLPSRASVAVPEGLFEGEEPIEPIYITDCAAPSLGDAAFVSIPAETWDFDGFSWKMDGETFVSSGHGVFASSQAPASELEVRAPVRPERCRNPARASLGIVAYGSSSDYWQLTLVKTSSRSGSCHRFELRAMSDGEWGREREDARLLEIRDCGTWEFGHEYELSLRCGPDRTVGQVTDVDSGEVLFRAVYGPATSEGGETVFAAASPSGYRPALCVEGFFRGRVDGMLARGSGAPEICADAILPECVPVAGKKNDVAALVGALVHLRAAAEETVCAPLFAPDSLRARPGTGKAGLRGEAAATWRQPDPEEDHDVADESSASSDRSRQFSLAAAPDARARSCSKGLPGGAGPLVAPPHSEDGSFSPWTDRLGSPRVGLGLAAGHDHGAEAAWNADAPDLAASGGPVRFDVFEWKHDPPPAEVAAGPPAVV